MKLKIKGDASHPEKTEILDAETGKPLGLEGIERIEVYVEPFALQAVLVLKDFEVDFSNLDCERSEQ